MTDHQHRAMTDETAAALAPSVTDEDVAASLAARIADMLARRTRMVVTDEGEDALGGRILGVTTPGGHHLSVVVSPTP